MRVGSILLAAFLAAAGCGGEKSAPSHRGSSSSAEPASDPEFRPMAGGLSWQAEEPLVYRRAQNDMRAAEYVVRGHPSATLGVFYFPPTEGGGGDVHANLDRWLGQFTETDGRSAREAAEIEHLEINDLEVTRVDVRGTFVGRRGMAANPVPREGFRLLGAIVEGPRGLVFFKLIGPEPAVGVAADAFERLVRSIHPA